MSWVRFWFHLTEVYIAKYISQASDHCVMLWIVMTSGLTILRLWSLPSGAWPCSDSAPKQAAKLNEFFNSFYQGCYALRAFQRNQWGDNHCLGPPNQSLNLRSLSTHSLKMKMKLKWRWLMTRMKLVRRHRCCGCSFSTIFSISVCVSFWSYVYRAPHQTCHLLCWYRGLYVFFSIASCFVSCHERKLGHPCLLVFSAAIS